MQLDTVASKCLTSAEARQEEAARSAGVCWLRTLSAGGALTRLTLAGLARDVPRCALALQWRHRLDRLQDLSYQPRCRFLAMAIKCRPLRLTVLNSLRSCYPAIVEVGHCPLQLCSAGCIVTSCLVLPSSSDDASLWAHMDTLLLSACESRQVRAGEVAILSSVFDGACWWVNCSICHPAGWHSTEACCLRRPEDNPGEEPTVTIWDLPSLARLSIVDTDSVMPAPYPHLRELTWHTRVRGTNNGQPSAPCTRVCPLVMSGEPLIIEWRCDVRERWRLVYVYL